MPSVTRASARLLRRARRIPNRLRREYHRTRDRLPRRTPTLSVVVPVYNVREWIAASLDTLVSQSLTDLEIIVVDDGSTDGSVDVVRRYAASDPRIRIVSQANAGLGAARNVGADHATGRFIAFFDSDDLLMPGAYEAMVGQLRRTGSDFVTAAFARGDETFARRPNWVNRTMGRDRTCLTLPADPWLLLDITAWNKVFRRSFWVRHRFRFMEGVRYEDQVPITRAYLTARSFDVLRQQVYVWRTRFDGTSITQQKSSLPDLTDRLRSQQECALLINRAPDSVRDTWYLKLLDYDLPNYLGAALNADEGYNRVLRTRLESLRREVPENVWHQVPFRNRSKSWLLSHGRLDLCAELSAWFEREGFGLPVEERSGPPGVRPAVRARGRRPARVAVPGGRARRRAGRPAGRDPLGRPRARAARLRLPGARAPAATPRMSSTCAWSVRTGSAMPLAVTRFTDPALDTVARLAHLDMSDERFRGAHRQRPARRARSPGQSSLGLEFHQRQGEFERVSDITHVVGHGSGASRQPRECGGRLVRLAGVAETGSPGPRPRHASPGRPDTVRSATDTSWRSSSPRPRPIPWSPPPSAERPPAPGDCRDGRHPGNRPGDRRACRGRAARGAAPLGATLRGPVG